VVLDEPNASLDGEGEEALVRAMFAAKGWGATIVLVAHQPRILAPCEKLLMLRNGAVEAFGARDEVLARLRQPYPAAVSATMLSPTAVRAEPASMVEAG
jgi:ABC-type protease/lipase transport system fused ATPase/permease subunit